MFKALMWPDVKKKPKNQHLILLLIHVNNSLPKLITIRMGAEAQKVFVDLKKDNLYCVYVRDNTLDRPISADTAQIPPTEWGSHLVCSARMQYSA